ncbi:MAG TPA: alpha-1,2-fucosyltransferase [Oculatellaceae cyanobacterium]
MIVVQIINGFGNQLFQYATARQVAKRLGMAVKLDLSAFGRLDNVWKFQLDYFQCDYQIATEQEIFELADPYIFHTFGFGFTKKLHVANYVSPTHFLERTPPYDEKILSIKNNHYLEGYFQHERYIDEIRPEIVKEVQRLREEFVQFDEGLLDKIKTCNSIALHVRRGDYASNADINKTYGVCSAEYYQQALRYLEERVNNPHVFIFSNDVDWCRNELTLNVPTTYVSGSFDPPVDFYLMRACKHFVIANSTFSWLAAYLGDAPDKIVVEPERFFADFNHKFPGTPEPDLNVESWIKF